MEKHEVEKFVGNYVDIICGFDDIETESFGGVLTGINNHGEVCVDYGYSVRLEHIIDIKPTDMEELELD